MINKGLIVYEWIILFTTLSSDKNRKPSSKNMAKNNASGSTSLSNNAIQNAKQLSRVDKHNYRKYDNNSELIEIIKGTTSLYEDVKNLFRRIWRCKTWI